MTEWQGHDVIVMRRARTRDGLNARRHEVGEDVGEGEGWGALLGCGQGGWGGDLVVTMIP